MLSVLFCTIKPWNSLLQQTFKHCVFLETCSTIWNTLHFMEFLLSKYRNNAQNISVAGKQHCCSGCLPFWTLRVLRNYDSESHVIIPQMGLVELINLQAGEMGQLVLDKTFGWVFLLTPQKETNSSDKHCAFTCFSSF